ncbi:MAG: COX15/CtaA family protein [Nevskiales bacterium]
MIRTFRWLVLLSCALALVLVVLGAYVRLSHAGLSCPDWPGCYGRMSVPTASEQVTAANRAYPQRPLQAHKAWKEMAHRYVAGALGLLILLLALLSRRDESQQLPRRLPLILLALVVFQALLGMWTVTLLLKPLVVTAHLLGGMATLALLFWLWLEIPPNPPLQKGGDGGFSHSLRRDRDVYFSMLREHEGVAPLHDASRPSGIRWLAGVALALLTAQIFLGGWTSSNYAALACTGFPGCHGQWWPAMDFRNAFTLWRGLGVNYEYGVLEHPARTAIHMTHRLGAVAVSLYFTFLGLLLLSRRWARSWRFVGAGLLGLLALQMTLGLSVVLLHLPLPLAAAHNGGAALLLLATVALNFLAWKRA